jgi:hypothetical protein
VLQGCHSPCSFLLCDVPFRMHHVLQGCHSLLAFLLCEVPFRMHHMLQGCHSPTYASFTRRALQDAPRAPRVPLANLHFFCATCPSGCTTCSKGATCFFRFFCAKCPSGCTTCSKGDTRQLVFLLRDVPFRMHHVLQGCHSPSCVSFARRALQDAPRAPRVPLTNLTDW